mgnify:FL=1
MFDKLRWKLTAFNSIITSGIMICLVLLCLSLSERNTKDQTYKNFTDTVYAVSSYLEVQNQISDDWLRQMEADPNVHISVLDAGMPLFSMTLSPEKEKLEPVFQTAWEIAQLPSGKNGYRLFSMDGYYAAAYRIEKQDSMVDLILLYSLAQMEAGIENQRVLVFLASSVAVFVLVIFSWLFTGKMLRPIQENQQRQTEFIAAASHELRTPLAAILSAASAMERAEPMQRSQFSDMIHREGNRMSRLIGDMLTLSSSDSKGWALQKQPVELDMLLLEVYEAHYPLAKEQGIELTLSLYEQNVPSMNLDRDGINQVLSILLDNARNHTPAPGKIELELTVHRKNVQIRVSDTGPGVPDNEKRRIFERFYRSEKSRSHRGHFGLGLSIAAEIVKMHNGRIWVQDATIGGAEFVVELPLV